ncbi:TPA: ParB family protein [Salmonella enterica subsp. enterica serovar Oranienburg]
MGRKTIGRQLNSQATAEDLSSTERTQYFTLKTGRKVKFSFVSVPASEVSDKTFVNQDINGRDQSALTKESLKEIINTIRSQQFFPCIGVRNGEQIEILDGSRRRAAAIHVHGALDVMVTADKLNAGEARQLAKEIQTAKEHNIREIGLRLLKLKESGMSQKDIAQSEGLSAAKVTRALQAASVPQELISLFPVQSELSLSDYKTLAEIDSHLADKNISYYSLISNISESLDVIISDDHIAEDERKNGILKIIQQGSLSLLNPPLKDKVMITPLWNFSEKDKYARKKVKGRNFSYEFSRLTKEVQQELDQAITDVLNRHLS